MIRLNSTALDLWHCGVNKTLLKGVNSRSRRGLGMIVSRPRFLVDGEHFSGPFF